jgi:hypothetical protein
VHPVGELDARALDDQVVVVVHQAEGVDGPVEAADDAFEPREEEDVVEVVEVDPAAVHPAGRHVVDAIGEQEAREAGHASTVAPDRARIAPVDRSFQSFHTEPRPDPPRRGSVPRHG